MANFTTWTVLPHKPIERIAANLWRVQGTMPDGKTQRQMVAARMDDGRLVIHNAIALEAADMAALEAWGEPAILAVPNSFHRQDAAIWKQRYPRIQVVAPTGATKRVAKAVAVDHAFEAAPHDAHVRLLPMAGVPMEGVLEVKTEAGVALTFCDAVLNMPKLGFPMSMMLGPTGRISAPRVMRLIGVKDKAAFANQLEQLAATPNLKQLMFGHGKPITDDAPGALRQVVAQLRG